MLANISFFKDKLSIIRSLQETGVKRIPLDLDQEELPLQTCLNCDTQFRGSFCPHCGQKANTHRLGWSTVADHLINSATNLEKGFLRTCIDLFYRPGYLMRDYIRGRRTDYNKPIQMLFVLATLHVIVHLIFFQTTGFYTSENDLIDIEQEAGQKAALLLKQIVDYLGNNQAASSLVFIVMLVIPNWLFFKFTEFGKKLNIVEHFYIMTFVGCQLMILNILEIPYARLFHAEESMTIFSSGYSFLIAVWDFKQLCQISFPKSFRLLVFSSILAFIIFILLIVASVLVYLSLHPEVYQSIVS